MTDFDIPDIEPIEITIIRSRNSLPSWASPENLARFLHLTMRPWEDKESDILDALAYCFSSAEGRGGFLVLADLDQRLVGAVVVLDTGMAGYVPEHLLLFISVDPEFRGRGLGHRLLKEALGACLGAVKLHVEYDNPAVRLYERVGFQSKYAEMRFQAP